MMPARRPTKEITRWSSSYGGARRGVGLISIHESVGVTDAMDLALFCERRGVSYHAVCDNTTMVYTVPRSKTAWHLRDGNPYADGLCLCTPVAGYSRLEWLGPQLPKVEYAAWWLAGVCKDRGVPVRHLSHEQIREVLSGKVSSGGVIGHVDYTYATGDGNHTDPRNFPYDVCIYMALAIDTLEDDMAQVPQSEWNATRDRIATMYGDRGPDDRQTSRRVDTGYVDNLVWDHPITNSQGKEVAAKHVLAAIEERLMRIETAIATLNG